jgi:Zn finger protein HypA/HybF involved in hydrogenase expression
VSDTVKCDGKHTKYQPSDNEWRCPRCGASAALGVPGGNTFIIAATEEGADENCTINHAGDELACDCGYTTSGKAFAARLQKAANMVPCPACKGHGLVKGAP